MIPKVSVIVPNYQHARYLAQRLDSIASQTYQNFEVILLDDASADESVTILKSHADQHEHWSFYPNQSNSASPFKQWQKGINYARGEFIWFAESDDFADPKFLESLVPILEEKPQVGIVYAQSMLIDELGDQINSYEENLRFIYKSEAWQKDFVISGKEACRKWLFYHNPIPNASGALIRKSAIDEIGGPETEMRLNGDWHFYAKVLLKYDLAFKAQILNYFRVHQKTQRSKSIKRASVYSELIAINKLLREGLNKADKEADAAMDEFANWWIGNLPYHSLDSENRSLNRKHYQTFKSYKNHLPWRIFLTFVISYLRDALKWLGILKPLKTLRARLYPGKYWTK